MMHKYGLCCGEVFGIRMCFRGIIVYCEGNRDKGQDWDEMENGLDWVKDYYGMVKWKLLQEFQY